MSRFTKIMSGVFRGPRRLVTDRLFPRYFAERDHAAGKPPGPPLNGQSGRMAIMEAIVAACSIERIVETGTFQGSTTAWMARFGLPIRTVEANARFAHFARARLANERLIQLSEMDSAAFVAGLARDKSTTAPRTLFYLDAHWGRRLPLAEEIRTIAGAFHAPVIVIDDFEVPDDPDYGFDNYGPGKKLDLDYVRGTGMQGLAAFFPMLRGREETGTRRGCIALTTTPAMAERLRGVPLLRQYPI